MKNIKDIAFLVQARLSSQRCPQKMIRPFAGTTLLDISVEKLVESELIPNENIYVSVYEDELVEIAEKYPVNIFHRSKKSAMSEGTPMTEIYEWWDKIPHKYVILVNACTPMLSVQTIDDFTEEYLKTDNDGLFGVIQKKNYFWNSEGDLLTSVEEAVMNTKTAQTVYEAAHCLYAGSLQKIGEGIWMGDFTKKGDIQLHPVPEEEVFDIDYEWQFKMCEALYRGISNT
jgi:CMP-N-acetylneuraminic acid synthetase